MIISGERILSCLAFSNRISIIEDLIGLSHISSSKDNGVLSDNVFDNSIRNFHSISFNFGIFVFRVFDLLFVSKQTVFGCFLLAVRRVS